VNPLPALVVAAAAFGAWTYFGAPNPYTMRGPDFFWFFIPAIAVALLLMRALYPVVRQRYVKPYRRFRPLD
jgi:Na+/proline symporter